MIQIEQLVDKDTSHETFIAFLKSEFGSDGVGNSLLEEDYIADRVLTDAAGNAILDANGQPQTYNLGLPQKRYMVPIRNEVDNVSGKIVYYVVHPGESTEYVWIHEQFVKKVVETPIRDEAIAILDAQGFLSYTITGGSEADKFVKATVFTEAEGGQATSKEVLLTMNGGDSLIIRDFV